VGERAAVEWPRVGALSLRAGDPASSGGSSRSARMTASFFPRDSGGDGDEKTR